jgi:two-component system response regulator PhoP
MDIAIVDPDQKLAGEIQRIFAAENMQPWIADSAESFYRALLGRNPILVITELDLPGEEGLSLIRTVRQQSNRGVIVLSRQASPNDRLRARSEGADGFFQKPVLLPELILAARRLIDRLVQGAPAQQPPTPTNVAPIVLDPARGVLLAKQGQIEINLSSREFALIQKLAANPNQVVSKEELHRELFPKQKDIDPHRIEVVVSRVRKKLQDSGITLPVRAIFGRGLCFVVNTQSRLS